MRNPDRRIFLFVVVAAADVSAVSRDSEKTNINYLQIHLLCGAMAYGGNIAVIVVCLKHALARTSAFMFVQVLYLTFNHRNTPSKTPIDQNPKCYLQHLSPPSWQ